VLAVVIPIAAADWADFKFIRDEVGPSDSALSKQLTTLEEAGYLEIRKGFAGKRPRTSARLSRGGRAAFEMHVAALQRRIPGAAPTNPLLCRHVQGTMSVPPDNFAMCDV
jgi:hypothetical protein